MASKFEEDTNRREEDGDQNINTIRGSHFFISKLRYDSEIDIAAACSVMNYIEMAGFG